MTPSADCIKMVQQFEGCAKRRPDGSFAAYPDPGTGADPWTIGWGTTGADVKRGCVPRIPVECQRLGHECQFCIVSIVLDFSVVH